MAVAVQLPIYLKTGMWNSGNPSPRPASTDSNPAPSSMAYQYTLPSSETSSASMIPSYHHIPPDGSQPNSPALTKASSPATKTKGLSKSAKIKRSMSTPNVRGQATADAAALALSAEKRRNKLGYHRTSVACGHCRRRKIRCIPAPADPQNRCSNCIRLKKECNFFPVDQQPPQDTRRRSSKAQSGTGRASESSSPSTTSGQMPETQHGLPYPTHLNMPPIQDLGGPQMKRHRTESFSPEAKVVTSSRNFEYSNAPPNWMAPDASPGIKPQVEPPQAYWRRPDPQESPITPAFSPYTPQLNQIPPPQIWNGVNPESGPREDLQWPLPQRSISYSNLEGIQGQPQYGYQPSHQQNHQHTVSEHYTTKPRIQSNMYPPPISTSGPHSATEPHSATSEPQHSQSAGAVPSHYPHWQQPYSYQKPVGPGEAYGGWHGGPPHMSEENHAPPVYGYGMPEPPMRSYGESDLAAPMRAYYPPPPGHAR